MGDTSETNTKVLSRELFLGVVTLKMPIPQHDKVPFLKSGHILFMTIIVKIISIVMIFLSMITLFMIVGLTHRMYFPL